MIWLTIKHNHKKECHNQAKYCKYNPWKKSHPYIDKLHELMEEGEE